MADILQQYAKAREALIAEDRRLRRDSSRESSEVELKADKVVRDIRAAEAVSVWWAEHPDIPHPFPGMEFLTGKSVIVKTEIFKILSKMPKGGLLHAHLDATVDVKCLLSLAYKHPALHIRVPEAVHAASIHTLLPEFKAFPKQEHSEVLELAQSPMQWVQLSKARETFPAELGGAQGFDKWLTASMMINPSEAYGTHNTVAKIWQKFTNTFSVASCLTRYAPIFRDYVREFLLTSIADGISYVEPRINFRHRFMDDIDGNECVPHREWLVMFDEVLKEVKEDMRKQGREDEFIGAKIIYTTLRFITPEELTWYTEDCIALKKEFPHLIAGFDLVGNENELKPLIDYLEPLLQFQERQKEEGVEIPFLFHAGETFGDGTEADMNMYDAILLGTKRIGHGFSLVRHPRLMEICRERGIALEVCPISNEILRLTSSMPTHPLPILFNNGVPVALCCDDPSIFGNMGLTFDFYQVLVSSEVTGLVQLAEVARDSIKYSMLDPEEKQHALECWERQWAKFVQDIPGSSPPSTSVQTRLLSQPKSKGARKGYRGWRIYVLCWLVKTTSPSISQTHPPQAIFPTS
ncbi:metallo-dependent hydrolases superfamily protein [Pleurotus pulmonarius]